MYLLDQIELGDKETLMRLCRETYKGESALDLAGSAGSVRAALVLVQCFQRHYASVNELCGGYKISETELGLKLRAWNACLDKGVYDFPEQLLLQYVRSKGELDKA
jgi:hypothetical protein